jgi:hypothetical protein
MFLIDQLGYLKHINNFVNKILVYLFINFYLFLPLDKYISYQNAIRYEMKINLQLYKINRIAFP